MELTEFHLTVGWREGNRWERWASHPSGQLGQLEKSQAQWRQERRTFHGTLVFRVPPTNVVSDTHHLLTTRVLTYCIPLYFSHFAVGC